MNAADVLEAAADALFVYGRCRGRVEEHGAFCVLGAIQHVRGRDPQRWGDDLFKSDFHVPRDDPASLALSEYLVSHVDEVFEGVWSWNDTRRGPEGDAEVIDTLRLCAKDLRNGESE